MFIKLSSHEQYLKLTNNVEEGTNKLTHYSYLDKISIEAKIIQNPDPQSRYINVPEV
jgi:hypothetical protein